MPNTRQEQAKKGRKDQTQLNFDHLLKKNNTSNPTKPPTNNINSNNNNKNNEKNPNNINKNNTTNNSNTSKNKNNNPKPNNGKTISKPLFNALSQSITSVLKNGGDTQKRNKYQISLRRDTKRISRNKKQTDQHTNLEVLKATTKYRSRATLKIVIPASTNPVQAASKILMDLLSQIRDISDKNACFIPWTEADEATTDIIDDPTNVPSKLSELAKFFPRLFPGRPHQENIVYTKIYLGHDEDFESITTDIKYWLMNGNHGLYYNMLQAENIEVIGWLLYSTKANDAGALAEDLYEKFHIQVGLRWMTIDSGTKGKIPNTQKVYALHVEAIKSEKNIIKKALLKIYSRVSWSRSSDLPNSMKLRFVTMRKEATSLHSITKLDRLRIRQKGFLSAVIKSDQNWDILHLDYRLRDNTPTLREMIMGIRSTTHDTNLYLSVDLDWQKSGFVFQYLPEVKEEASSMAHTLYPYLLWQQGVLREDPKSDVEDGDEDEIEPLTEEELQKFFDGDALMRMEDMEYDPVKKAVIDRDVDNYLEFIDDEDLLGNKFDKMPEQEAAVPDRPEPQALESNIYKGSDDDTISTLGVSVYNSPVGRQRTKPRRVRINPEISDNEPTTPNNPTPTHDSIKALESKIDDINNRNTQLFEQLLQHLPHKSNTDEISQSSSGSSNASRDSSSAGEGR